MLSTNKDLRAKARMQLQGKWGTPMGVCFIFILISLASSVIPGIGGLASLALSGPLMFGLILYALKFIRNENAELSNLFEGFNNFTTALGLYLWGSLWIFLWCLLLIIPGIVKAISYSFSFYVLAENPQIGVKEALNVSKRITMGYKGKIFLLQLSFVGWAILCILTLGIGLLWLWPYIQITFANLYEELKAEAISKGSFNASGSGNSVSV